ncbi:MAG: tRNA pseudouridine(38-40) synthase TruA [Selenomonadaceae bacterium]|nr:tRNA pseudouridine(38-40) synthase TruA [Selenomonadaceae bacterium]
MSKMRNIALLVAYDGTNYHGFQRQTRWLAIQNVLEDRLSRVFGGRIELAAAGRTDAGVHARGQVVNFFTEGTIPIDRITIAAASVLPSDIVVRRAWEADENFSARFSVVSKIYTYRLHVGETSDPLIDRYAWHVRPPIDVESMSAALKLLVGTHDFSAFRSSSEVERNPVRTIFDATIDERFDPIGDRLLTIRLHADGFLYKMARNIVGAAVKVGRGRMTLDELKNIFDGRDRNAAPPPAPALGLCLSEVYY